MGKRVSAMASLRGTKRFEIGGKLSTVQMWQTVLIAIALLVLACGSVGSAEPSRSPHTRNGFEFEHLFVGYIIRYEAGAFLDCEFGLDIEAEGILSARFEAPSGLTYDLVQDDDDFWEFIHRAPTMEDVEALFPNGTYTLTVTHAGGQQQVTLQTLASVAMPAAIPRITAPAHGRSDVGTPSVTVEWEAPPAPDYLVTLFEVWDEATNDTLADEFLDDQRTEYQVDGLAANRFYMAELAFANAELDLESLEGIPYVMARLRSERVFFSTNTVAARFAPIAKVGFYRGYDEQPNQFQFEFEMNFNEPLWPPDGDALFDEIWLWAPDSNRELLYASHVHGHHGDNSLKFKAVSHDLEELRRQWPDGWYLLEFHTAPDEIVVTSFWFGVPDTFEPLAFPSQQPAITAPATDQAVPSPVEFAWNPVTDLAVNTIVFGLVMTDSEDMPVDEVLAPAATGYGPQPLAPGDYEALLVFANAFLDQANPDGIDFEVAAYRASASSFNVIELPTTGALTVTIDPPEVRPHARWRLNGGAWQVSAALLDGLPPEPATIDYLPVPGWTTPDLEQVDIAAGETAELTGTYSQIILALEYTAGPNGTLVGEASQVVVYGDDGTPVSAVPDEGYRFVEWSDGRTDNPRQDADVIEDIDVTALFELIPAAAPWTVTISLTGAAHDALRFGMAPGATNDYDPDIDELMPTPGEGEPAAYFHRPDSAYRADYRAESSSAAWMLIVSAGVDSDIDLFWNPAADNFPQEGFLSIVEIEFSDDSHPISPIDLPVGDSAVNMAALSEIAVPAGVTRAWRIQFAPHLVADWALQAGWNLKALPIEPMNGAVNVLLAELLADHDTAGNRSRGQHGGAHDQIAWTWQETRHMAVDTLRTGVGYWIFALQDTVILIHGTPCPRNAINLRRGWNLVGASTATPLSTNPTLDQQTWWFDAVDNTYRMDDFLVPFRGQWIYAPESTMLYIDGKR